MAMLRIYFKIRGFDEDRAGYLGDIYEVGRMMCKKEKEEAYVRVVGS